MVSVSLAWRPKGTATDHKKSDGGGRENQKTKISSKRKCFPKTFIQSKTQRKNSCMNKDKSSNFNGLRGSQDGSQTFTPACQIFHSKRAFLSLLRKNAAWTEVTHIFRNVFLEEYVVHLKVKFGHFVQLVEPTDQWLATFYVSNYSTPVNFKKKAEIWQQILRYRFFCVFKARDFPSW